MTLHCFCSSVRLFFNIWFANSSEVFKIHLGENNLTLGTDKIYSDIKKYITIAKIMLHDFLFLLDRQIVIRQCLDFTILSLTSGWFYDFNNIKNWQTCQIHSDTSKSKYKCVCNCIFNLLNYFFIVYIWKIIIWLSVIITSKRQWA